MKIFLSKSKLIKCIKHEKDLGFVPTMGAIHEGHLSLVKKSINQSKKTIVSIFVNRPQFNKKSDFKKYPKTLKKDIRLLKKMNINFLYIPKYKEIYPKGTNNKIKINSFHKKLCGRFRPNHFKAVVDVIDKFIKIIKPKKIYLGNKDMQQLKIIEDYVKKNYLNIKIIGCNTIRFKNGLAYSSRNFLLSKKEISIASKIYNLIYNKKILIIKNKLFLRDIKKIIFDFGVKKIDYIDLLDINKIIKPYKKNKKYKIFIAYYLRNTRLIDNI